MARIGPAGWLLSIASGALLALAQPAGSLWYLAWLGLVPALVSSRDQRPGRRVLLGLVCGGTWAWLLVGAWLWPAAGEALSIGSGTAILLSFVAVQLFGGLYLAAFLCIWDAVRSGSGYFAPMLGGATWVGLEIARAHLLGGYPWGLLGHTQWQRLELIQLADVTGVYGLSFVIVAVNVAAADALEAARRRRSRELPVSCVIAFSLVAGTFLYGAWRLTNAVPPTATVRVQIVHTAWTEQGPESAERLFRHLIELTSAVPPQNAELVVWPENSIRFYVQVAPQATESIGRLLSPRNQYLLAGGPHYGRDGSGWIYHNSAHLFDAQGQIVGRHDKSLLVPLAEEAIGALPSVERAFRRGSDTHPLHAGRSSLGVLVCFEAIYPQLARRLVLQGANVLVNVTNDHLIGAGAAQQAAMAVFRAVENRVPLIRVSNLGPSLTVDPFGRVATLPASQPGSVVSTLTLASGATPYNQVGDLFAFACAAISLACVVGRARTFVRGTVRTIGRISSSQ